MRVRLVPVEAGESTIEITKDLVLVGRKEDCDLQLDHKSISKQHCVIVKTDGLLLLRDLGSTNGTRVNGQRVRRAALLPNDQLNIASLKFKVQFSEDEEESVDPEQYTQQLDAKDIERIMRKTSEAADLDDDSSAEINLPPMKANELPDMIEEEKAAKKR